MSGIAGILHSDGAPVDAGLLHRLTQSLAFRGPDAQLVWLDGHVGFGHTQLRTTPESEREQQPFTLDGRIWITADARIDAREELKDRLRERGQECPKGCTDAELILRAYQAWGDDCAEQLLGDFAFAIWDASRRRLFCACDQIGIKPFFYVHKGPLFLFSNTLDCLRRHPGVSRKLNELAIADFLLFDMNQDAATTTFADIQRLPPAHTLVCEDGRVAVRRYWTLSVTTPVQFRRDEEYVERFVELLDAAVADRVRGGSAGVLMSGGLDSPTVAASAQRVLTRGGIANGVRAYTDVFDRLIPHEERRYAALVAAKLGLPIQFFPSDDAELFGEARRAGFHTPEPVHSMWPNRGIEQLRACAAHSRVVLTGYGADPGLSCRITLHFRELTKAGRYARALADAARYLSAEKRVSRLYLRTRLRLLRAPKSAAPSFPEWLNEDFSRRLELLDRWRAGVATQTSPGAVRPETVPLATAAMWPYLFEHHDPGLSGVPVEAAHPFFDLRLLPFLLALPRLPWCSDKQILRDAARGVLPDEVRLRRKSPLSADPGIALLRCPESAWVDAFEASPELEAYIVRHRIPPVCGEKSSWAAWIHLRPMSLNLWLSTESLFQAYESEDVYVFGRAGGV